MDNNLPQHAQSRMLLLFSGGRDSTIAAMRLAELRMPMRLVTVSAGHLHGLHRVRERLAELQIHLPDGTLWQCVKQPAMPDEFDPRFSRTCLPCQRDYVAIGARLALADGINQIALGYASYQSDWPEQHPIAIERLTARMKTVGLELMVPSYDLDSKEAAEAQLRAYGLSHAALEQKCVRQITNICLSEDSLLLHLTHWEEKLTRSLARIQDIPLEITDEQEYYAAK